MHRLPKFTIGSAAAFLTVIAGVLLYLFEPLALQVIRNAAFDQYQRWQPRAYDSKVPVRIVDVDDESLTRMGQWPWPRTVVAQLIEKLQDSGAAAIGFDVVFAEEDRTSPKAMAATWGVSGDLRERLLRNPDHDEVMRKARQQIMLQIRVKENIDRAAQLLEKCDLVGKVEIVKGTIHTTLKADTFDYSAIPTLLIEHGFQLTLFREEEVNLETAFMSLTKGLVQ